MQSGLSISYGKTSEWATHVKENRLGAKQSADRSQRLPKSSRSTTQSDSNAKGFKTYFPSLLWKGKTASRTSQIVDRIIFIKSYIVFLVIEMVHCFCSCSC